MLLVNGEILGGDVRNLDLLGIDRGGSHPAALYST